MKRKERMSNLQLLLILIYLTSLAALTVVLTRGLYRLFLGL